MRLGLLVASLAALLAALPAHASFMQGETLAKAANVLAIIVIILVPVSYTHLTLPTSDLV